MNERYALRFSAHGMAFQPLRPAVFDKSYEEAKKEADDWIVLSDTVGGDAVIVTEESQNLWP